MSVELYIYWRPSPEHTAPALQAVAAMQRRLRQQVAGLDTRLLLRQDPPTVMEIYQHPDGISPVLEQHIAQEAQEHLQPWQAVAADGTVARRHVERFVAVAPD